MVWLGFSYREGDGVPCDHAEAVRWFIKAVEAGDAHSMIHVGRMYARYLSSPAQAVGWFLRAAEAGFTESFVERADLLTRTRNPEFTIPPRPTNGIALSPSIRKAPIHGLCWPSPGSTSMAAACPAM